MADFSNLDESLNVSSGTIFASTPFKVPAAVGKKRSKTRNYIRPVCDTCQVCGKEYRCHRSYLNHRRQHTIKESASKFPKVAQILEYCSSAVFQVVTRLLAKPAYGKMGGNYKKFLDDLTANADSISMHSEWIECFQIIHKAVTQDIGEHKILLPSVILNRLLKNNENFLSDVEQRKKLCELLKVNVVIDERDVEVDLLYCFVTDYSLMLVTEIFRYYSCCLKSDVQESDDEPSELTPEEKETVHYVSGAVVRSFYNKSKSFPNSVGWSRIGKLIVEKLLESDSVPGPPAIFKGWTTAKNKGKLFFVSGVLFDFFVGVAEISKKTTHKKFRVDANNIIEAVCQGSVVLLWDEAVGDSCNETASYDLMCGFVRSFCTTYAVGKSRQLINKIRQSKAETSLALRAKVAPKSSS